MTSKTDDREDDDAGVGHHWRTDGWKYTDEESGIHESRHEAIGAAAVSARRLGEKYPERPVPTPIEATRRVYAFMPYRCGYCSKTFLTEAEKEDHQPCPVWQEDQPIPPEGGSNPIEAARMTREGL